ncbi:hypothetical protein [Dactylosporangium fulvum]|uniref:Reverse transcriptase domain-containing protein n=1 Tax=Dactylosporangium fulvum TaxID=53359 RepID=A0ABY5VU44_9ACTN|nr:hypothetical protein [Dactylosporangium fulvum]UWP81258.1 hypothetical protein Dfulv_40060 [Dactylosporangium fulvum]
MDDAVAQEAAAEEPLFPQMAGWKDIAADTPGFTQWLRGQLEAGMPTSRGLVVMTPKPVHGSRPVAIWGFAERVTYRAITNLLLDAIGRRADRSREAFREFLIAPLTYAKEIGSKPSTAVLRKPWPYDAIIEHIVKADLASFYEYVDHELLGRELLVLTGDYKAVDCLVDLLGDVQGRRFGLPQLLGPSDELSDIYGDKVLRETRRHGWPTWRFNDDFRIAVKSMAEATAALGDLEIAARDVGMILNEGKTRTPLIHNYFFENIADYGDGDEKVDPDWAVSVIANAYSARESKANAPEDSIDLNSPTSDDVRTFRAALTGLRDNIDYVDRDLLHRAVNIVRYLPSVTPWVLRIIHKIASTEAPIAGSSLSEMVTSVSLSTWQSIWLVRTINDTDILSSNADATALLQTWVTGQYNNSSHPVLRAEATVCLAAHLAMDHKKVVRALYEEPTALSAWYLTALKSLHARGSVPQDVYDAVRNDGGINRCLLP